MGLIADLVEFFGSSEADILRIVLTGPRRYKMYTIPKRTGAGVRVIAQPARELKSIQRYVVDAYLSDIKVHRCATAYVEGKSIRDNAFAHRKSRVILKLDFKNFFNSIVFRDLQSALETSRSSRLDRADWKYLENVLFWQHPATGKRCLSIGAPSSPVVSNIVMYQLDVQLQSICSALNAAYTRYADDITVSAESVAVLLEAEKRIRKVVRATKRPNLSFNEEKRGIFTQRGRRLVTGLVITPQEKVSLGRDRKRLISAAVHHIQIGKNTSIAQLSQTKGWLAYAKSVEPSFFRAMTKKYGSTVRAIMRTNTPARSELRRAVEDDLFE